MPDASSLWWQREDLGYRDGRLVFADRPVQALADRFGTPSFVYSAARIRANLDRLHGALTTAGLAGRFSLYYAMKANRFAPLLTFLKQSGLCGIDACSPAEVEHAVSCGFSPEEISFTATSLSTRDLDLLARYDGLSMDCDSLHAIRSWGARKPGTAIGLRVNPGMGIGRAANDKLHYAGSVTTKFGIYEEQFAEALATAKAYDLRVSKIHFHTGCGYLTPQLEQLSRIIGHCLRFVEAAGEVERVNIGGGLGVPHVAADQPLDLRQWADVLRRQFGDRGLHVEIEPGDYIVKDAGILLVEKTYVERKKDVLFVGVDAGFNIAPEPAHYSLPFLPLPLRDAGGPRLAAQVVGNINEALDVWYENAQLPDLTDPDHTHLALINAGAYSSAMASQHCLRGQFKEFLLF
ncbi:MAG: diaminopimelate decarboxylase [Desulfobulbus sp.]|jgi:diaminopimelate decarboxylase|uniref:diaminopimelate decarboxylase n=1 Tax=Desulfobulbus sp. TaxID=895 RepID=UPI00283CD6AA|nr:diaminopimelate decarboxylase [Desulfobulbus sp.]MDR2549996.1 diaminopimelate decarboxylase [Desulfobulbus sp.]